MAGQELQGSSRALEIEKSSSPRPRKDHEKYSPEANRKFFRILCRDKIVPLLDLGYYEKRTSKKKKRKKLEEIVWFNNIGK